MSKRVKKLRINKKQKCCKYRLNTYLIPDSVSSIMLKTSKKLFWNNEVIFTLQKAFWPVQLDRENGRKI